MASDSRCRGRPGLGLRRCVDVVSQGLGLVSPRRQGKGPREMCARARSGARRESGTDSRSQEAQRRGSGVERRTRRRWPAPCRGSGEAAAVGSQRREHRREGLADALEWLVVVVVAGRQVRPTPLFGVRTVIRLADRRQQVTVRRSHRSFPPQGLALPASCAGFSNARSVLREAAFGHPTGDEWGVPVGAGSASHP